MTGARILPIRPAVRKRLVPLLLCAPLLTGCGEKPVTGLVPEVHTGDGGERAAAYEAGYFHISGQLNRGAATLRDGTPIDAMEGDTGGLTVPPTIWRTVPGCCG